MDQESTTTATLGTFLVKAALATTTRHEKTMRVRRSSLDGTTIGISNLVVRC